MTSPATSSSNRGPRYRQAASMRFRPVLADLRLGLCSLNEPAAVRSQHLAALVAWSDPALVEDDTQMVVTLDHPASVVWLAEALDTADASVLRLGERSGSLAIRNPGIVLGRHGWRQGQWTFRPGHEAGLGLTRGAVQVAGVLSQSGLQVECPVPSMLLTLMAAMTRIGIAVQPKPGRVSVAAVDVPEALRCLGVSELVGKKYSAMRLEGRKSEGRSS